MMLLLGGPLVTRAQQTPADKTALAVQIAEARKANAALLRQYSWHCRTEVLDQSEVKDIRIELVNYGPDGRLQRSLLNDQGAPLPRGLPRGKSSTS